MKVETAHVEGSESDALFGQPVAYELFMIAREALLNATSHSGASTVNIYLQYGTHAFCMKCEDDGLGIENAARLTATSRPTYGLMGMRERASRIKAALEVWSSPGRGGSRRGVTVMTGQSPLFETEEWPNCLVRMRITSASIKSEVVLSRATITVCAGLGPLPAVSHGPRSAR